MRTEIIRHLDRIATALEALVARERRRVCRHCGQAECQGHDVLPDAEGPFTKPVLVAEPVFASGIAHAHREISRAAELIASDEERARRWQGRYRPGVEADRADAAR